MQAMEAQAQWVPLAATAGMVPGAIMEWKIPVDCVIAIRTPTVVFTAAVEVPVVVTAVVPGGTRALEPEVARRVAPVSAGVVGVLVAGKAPLENPAPMAVMAPKAPMARVELPTALGLPLAILFRMAQTAPQGTQAAAAAAAVVAVVATPGVTPGAAAAAAAAAVAVAVLVEQAVKAADPVSRFCW